MRKKKIVLQFEDMQKKHAEDIKIQFLKTNPEEYKKYLAKQRKDKLKDILKN